MERSPSPIKKTPSQDFLVHVGSCEKCLRSSWCDVCRRLLTADIISSLDQSGSSYFTVRIKPNEEERERERE